MQNSLKQRLARLELLEDRQLLYAAAAFAQDVDRSPFNFYDAVELGDEVYFPAEDATGDVELWKSDGTEAGTLRVKDVDATDSSTPHVLAATDSKVFFSAYETQRGRELWATDGTEEGTQLVADLQVGSVGFFDSEFGENLLQVTAVGEQIYFANNSELWISDGTATGTTLLRDTGERIRNLTTLNGKAYFHLDRELWESDGSTEGTKSLVSIGDEALPFFTELVASGESLYLSSGQSLIQIMVRIRSTSSS
jgi:ELWxxDGT repeat protein